MAQRPLVYGYSQFNFYLTLKAALSLCAEEFKNQKENLLAALTGKPVVSNLF